MNISPVLWADAQLDAFAADPWALYAPGVGQYALSGPATGVPGLMSSAFSVTLNAGVRPATPMTVTPVVDGIDGTFSPINVRLSDSARSATFSFTPYASSLGSGSSA